MQSYFIHKKAITRKFIILAFVFLVGFI